MEIKETGITLLKELQTYYTKRHKEELLANNLSLPKVGCKLYFDTVKHKLLSVNAIDFEIDPTMVWSLDSLAEVILRIEKDIKADIQARLSNSIGK